MIKKLKKSGHVSIKNCRAIDGGPLSLVVTTEELLEKRSSG
jgi:hypothetical protein